MIKRITLRIVIPLLLFVAGSVASLYFYGEVSFGSLQYFLPGALMTGPVGKELIRGQYIRGEFTATENNLGTVGLRVYTFNRINNDIIVFQLREKGTTKWTVFNKYFTDRFPTNEVFPFGFPVIADSKGKTYQFEIFSVNGVPGDAIAVGRKNGSIVTQYVYTRPELTANGKFLQTFLSKKAINLLSRPQFYVYLSVFYLPLFFYTVFYISRGWLIRVVGRWRLVGHGFLFLVISIYIFQPVLYKNNLSLMIAVMVPFIILLFRIREFVPFIYAGILIVLGPVWILLGMENIANSSAVMAFFLTATGIVTYALEYSGLWARINALPIFRRKQR